MAILTKYDKHERHYAPTGSIYLTTYEEEIDKKSGRKKLAKVGQVNVYEKIQADLEDTKIENIIHKLAMGDLSVFKKAQLTYADAEDFPKDLMEAQNIVVKAKYEFDQMPKEVREIFHNSPEEYVSMMGTQEFIEKMAPYNDSIAKHKKDEETAAFNAKVAETAAFNKAVNAAMEGNE